MRVYRLAKEKYIRDLSGAGARLYGGRWNRKGTPMLYSSLHCSLALLELMVHTPHNLLPPEMILLTLSVPEALPVSTLHNNDLPKKWRQYPAPDTLAAMGTRWVNAQKEAALKVPSVLVPDEWNLLLNPQHKSFKEISIESISPFQLDSRF